MEAFILDCLNVEINNGSLTQIGTNNGSLLHRKIGFELKKICKNKGSLLPRHISVKIG
jgi:hypothetical protein